VEKYGTAGQATDDNIIQHMCFACWITTTTNTHSDYAIITNLRLQKWLRKRATILRLCLCCCPPVYFWFWVAPKSLLQYFFIFCLPRISSQILVNNQPGALFHLFIYAFHLSTRFEHQVLIIRRSDCINTSSGMISLCDCLVCR
jgi:hypothetical protein